MGALRLFLAISVVIAHTEPLLGLQFLPSSEAVRIFFAISGFYMALILSEKYRDKSLLFYSNRALRIYPTYWIALGLTVAVALSVGGLGGWGLSPAELVAVVLSNVGIFGSDVLFMLHRGSDGWQWTFGLHELARDPNAVRAGTYLVVSPVWSLGTELLFYLIAPLLARSRTPLLVALAGASFGLQLYLDHLHPWSSYFFFPANICFFLYGMLGFRFSTTKLFARLDGRFGVIWALGALAILFLREFIPFFRNYSWMHYAAIIPAIPFVFSLSKTVRWDRWIGELSYPVYVLHAGVALFVLHYLGGNSVWWTLGITLCLSVAIVRWVDLPLEAWRARRVAKAGASGPPPVLKAAE